MEHLEDDDDEDEESDEMDADDQVDDQANQDEDVPMDGLYDSRESQSNSGSERRHSSSEHSEKSSASTARTVPSLEGEPRKQTSADSNTDAEDDMDIPSNTAILANKRAHPTFKRLFRSKGEFFLATRPHRAGDWSQAGAMLTLTGGRPWFCTLPPEEYTTGDKEVDSLVQHDIQKGGEWGDRRQELVFIGEKLDHANVEKLLDECLLNDGEMRKWENIMRDDKLDDTSRIDALQDIFDDGFPDWNGDGDEDDEMEDDDHHGHDHARGLKHNTLAKNLKEVD